MCPKTVVGAEVRCFSGQEYDEFNSFYKTIAKNIQRLPEKAPDPIVLASVGWRDISSQIDLVKLMFVQHILALDVNGIYRIMFIRRLYFIVLSGYLSAISPVAQIVKVLNKYGKVDDVIKMISSGTVSSKSSWKALVLSWIDDKVFASWRFTLTLYSKLDVFWIVFPKAGPVWWWQMSKALITIYEKCLV